MRKPFQPAGPTLRDALIQVDPEGLASCIPPGPGFRIQGEAGEASLEPVEVSPRRYRLGDTGMEAQVHLVACPEVRAVVQQVTLTNPTSRDSAPLRSLSAFYLPLLVRLRHVPYACGFGGGLTDGYYPPRAYREERVCFGLARTWEPNHPSVTRRLVSRRVFRLANEEGGRSANPYIPLMLAGWQSESGSMGLWAALEWSGRWELVLGTEGGGGRFLFRGGPRANGLVLGPGESLRLPAAHVGVFGGPEAAYEDGLNAIRRYVAEAVAPDIEGRRPWPAITYHHWFGIEENLTEPLLRQQADRAAELGAEYFEVDAGWYAGAAQNFADGVGNWERVDQTKFPHGLESFSQYVRSKGMRFGLWFEPERGRRGSDWARQHPDWYWDCGHPDNLHLDLTQAVVQDALVHMLSAWIERLDIRWLRWDYNQPPGPFWDRVDPTGKVQFAYVEGLYRVRETLRTRFPNLNIDTCASGGNRIDFGILRSSCSMVISDHAEDPHICRLMQTGGARIFPGNYMNSSFYIGPDDGDEGVGPCELISRMAGSMSFSGHIASWTPEHTTLVKRYLEGYRSFRHLLMKDFYALTPYPRTEADWDVVEFVDPDEREAVVLAYRVRGEVRIRRVYPRRLNPDKMYQVCDPFSMRKPRKVWGESLMEKGLRLTLERESGAVFHLIPEA